MVFLGPMECEGVPSLCKTRGLSAHNAIPSRSLSDLAEHGRLRRADSLPLGARSRRARRRAADRLRGQRHGRTDRHARSPGPLQKIVPEIGRPEIREFLHGSYRIIYRARNDRIEILTVFHHARLFEDWQF